PGRRHEGPVPAGPRSLLRCAADAGRPYRLPVDDRQHHESRRRLGAPIVPDHGHLGGTGRELPPPHEWHLPDGLPPADRQRDDGPARAGGGSLHRAERTWGGGPVLPDARLPEPHPAKGVDHGTRTWWTARRWRPTRDQRPVLPLPAVPAG